MLCAIHTDREAVAVCGTCGRTLCPECAGKYQPPTCPYCMEQWGKNEKSRLVMCSVVSLIFAGLGIWLCVFADRAARQEENQLPFFQMAVLYACLVLPLAGIPWGWSTLSGFTSSTFLFLPLIGWLIYISLKLGIAMTIGPFVAVFMIIKMRKNIALASTAWDLSPPGEILVYEVPSHT